jgi:hypothetical protein
LHSSIFFSSIAPPWAPAKAFNDTEAKAKTINIAGNLRMGKLQMN